MTLNPKQRFLKTDDAKVHADLVARESFLNALTAALAEMQMGMPRSTNPSTAWDAHLKMEGAKEFIAYLLNLSEVSDVPDKPVTRKLNPNTEDPLRNK